MYSNQQFYTIYLTYAFGNILICNNNYLKFITKLKTKIDS